MTQTDPADLWPMSRFGHPPRTFDAPGFDAPGFEAQGAQPIFLESAPCDGKPTRVFAWHGKPEGEGPFPGLVLVHGGRGTAHDQWVRMWTARGYAAIAVDTCGCVPVRNDEGNWRRHEHGGPAGWGAFHKADDPPEDQWMFHAVAAALVAHSWLRDQSFVDPRRVGLVGLSWGGTITAISLAADPRFAAGVLIYGCADFDRDADWLAKHETNRAQFDRWRTLWDPQRYVARIEAPTLWLSGPNDGTAPMDVMARCAAATRGPTRACFLPDLKHSQGAGAAPLEPAAFLSHRLQSGVDLPAVGKPVAEGLQVSASVEGDAPIKSGQLLVTCEVAGKLNSCPWQTLPADYDPATRRVRGQLPDGAAAWVLSVITADGLTASGWPVVLA